MHLLGRRAGSPTVVQRHSSWEHALLGDVDPGRLGQAAVSTEARQHVVDEQYQRIFFFFQNGVTANPTRRFPDVRWIQLSGSGLWVSYGELNALADYLPDAEAIDTLPTSVVEPVLKRMRSAMSSQVMHLRSEGEAESGVWEYVPGLGLVAEVKALDKATASLGANRYQGLLARNACHFAPFSWQRWALFHNEARANAEAYYRGRKTVRPIEQLDRSADENLRQAWLNNGYGDHFLQDSFASGHLVNKTLVMQWFTDYVNALASKWWDLLLPMSSLPTQPWYGMPDDEVMEAMGSAEQPEMAGRHLYGAPPTGGETTNEDRARGMSALDPQTAQERRNRSGRVAGSGVQAGGGRSQDQNYEAYLRFLNSTFLNLAGGTLHDYFNERGLSVSNERGDVLNVGGDDTLLSKSGPIGAELAGQASKMSRDAIDQLCRTGTTDTELEDIWELVPTSVFTPTSGGGWEKRSLEDWQDEVLHQICLKEIFPQLVGSIASKAGRLEPQLVEGGVELNNSPPVPPDWGDWIVPSGETRPA
jgi:hypothetical protein